MLTFFKRIETTKNSIFYSFIHYKNEIVGFGRNHYDSENKIKKIKIDESFNIIEDNNETFEGEDPRCFIHKETLYVTDNYLNRQKLYDYENKKFIKINSRGKNLSFISHNDNLYFIYLTQPFTLYNMNVIDGSVQSVITKNNYSRNPEYRGGTPGYKFKTNPNKYYGFGHRTYNKRIMSTNNKSIPILIHDIFLWIVDFTNKNPSIIVVDIEKPQDAKNICDPTCVIEINNKLYLVTAESEHSWFCEQDYITNVYEITDMTFLNMVLQ
jgi:hypothetical protein